MQNFNSLLTNQPTKTAVSESESEALTQKLVEAIVQAADDRKAADIAILKVTDVSYLADYFIIATGFSRIQIRAIADAIEKKVAETCHRLPLRTEGKSESNWIVQDYGSAIVHLFLPQEREFYNLEAFWGHAQRLPLPLSEPVGE